MIAARKLSATFGDVVGAGELTPEFERYAVTCESYDETRAPIGLEVYLGVFGASARPLSKQLILDAGCGTGNYSLALAPSVGRLHCIDREMGMLERARTKLRAWPLTVFSRASVLELPYASDTADGIMLNQVAHHLEDPGAERRYEKLAAFASESARILTRGGALVINTSSPEQVVRGYWWAELIPSAVAMIARRYPPLPRIQELLLAAGFETVYSYVALDAVLQARNYLDPEGPLKPEWRAGDSTWALATEEELRGAQMRVRTMLADGTMDAFLARRESERAAVGQTTFVCARMPR